MSNLHPLFQSILAPYSPSNTSLFEQCADAVKKTLPVKKDWVWDMDFTVFTDTIVATLIRSYTKGVLNENATDTYIINHEDFRPWAESCGLLDCEYGVGEDAFNGQMSYADYLKGELCKSDIKSYLLASGKAQGYEFGF